MESEALKRTKISACSARVPEKAGPGMQKARRSRKIRKRIAFIDTLLPPSWRIPHEKKCDGKIFLFSGSLFLYSALNVKKKLKRPFRLAGPCRNFHGNQKTCQYAFRI
jgi:hypothetical protein